MNLDNSMSDSNKSHDQAQDQHHHSWVQVPSRSGNDAQDTAILSSIQSIDRSRLKRTRAAREKEGDAATTNNRSSSSRAVTPAAALPPPVVVQKPHFRTQHLSLDRGAIAPALARPTAPFAKSERKKAYMSAVYYSECFLRNIQPRDADSAAFTIQNQYTKWWVNAKANNKKNVEENEEGPTNIKRRRLGSQQDNDAVVPDHHQVSPSPSLSVNDEEVVTMLKERLVEHLQKTGGDTTTTEFQSCMEQLRSIHLSRNKGNTSNNLYKSFNGTWLTLTKPTYSECLGQNETGEFRYTLGRMSFDMFRPTNLKCSIRAVMNNVRPMDRRSKPQTFPHRLKKELKQRGRAENIICHYDIVVAFTIEANQTRSGKDPSEGDNEYVIPRPIRGLLTNYGYMVADPDCPTRSSVWFSGGSMEVQDELADAEIWSQIFDESAVTRGKDREAMANLLAAKLLLGAYTTTTKVNTVSGTATTTHDAEDHPPSPTSSDDDAVGNEESVVPTMSYFFKRPIGGHGDVFCDILYIDETLRIAKGHHGSIFVCTKVPTLEETATEE